jgi:NADPH-dependent ferric siderophore reductase
MDREDTGVLGSLTNYLARKGRRAWPLTVAEKTAVTPRMTRIRFAGTDIAELEWKRGQDFVLEIPDGPGIARRHYTIRNFDAKAQTLDIDFVLHGDSPAGRWLAKAEAGAPLTAVGPRGHTYLREADWHLFIGDETGIPGIFAMLEGLPAGARAQAIIEVGNDEDRVALHCAAHVVLEWVSRDGAAAGPGKRLYDKVERFAFPAGPGQAYVIGETSNVRAIRHRLIERGLAKTQIVAEGYWRPGRVGGHDHV